MGFLRSRYIGNGTPPTKEHLAAASKAAGVKRGREKGPFGRSMLQAVEQQKIKASSQGNLKSTAAPEPPASPSEYSDSDSEMDDDSDASSTYSSPPNSPRKQEDPENAIYIGKVKLWRRKRFYYDYPENPRYIKSVKKWKKMRKERLEKKIHPVVDEYFKELEKIYSPVDLEELPEGEDGETAGLVDEKNLSSQWKNDYICDVEPTSDFRKVKAMSSHEFLQILGELGLNEELKKSTSNLRGGSNINIRDLPLELREIVVQHMVRDWKERDTDLYSTLYQIRSTDYLAEAWECMSDNMRAALPSANTWDRLRSFVEVHCGFNQLNSLDSTMRLWNVTPNPHMYTADPIEDPARYQNAIFMRLIFYIACGTGNIKRLPRLMLRDVWDSRADLYWVEAAFPDHWPNAPSIGRCIDMELDAYWFQIFDLNMEARDRDELRRYLLKMDEYKPSMSQRGPPGCPPRRTYHATMMFNTIATLCLFDSENFRRYPHIGPQLGDVRRRQMIQAEMQRVHAGWIHWIEKGN